MSEPIHAELRWLAAGNTVWVLMAGTLDACTVYLSNPDVPGDWRISTDLSQKPYSTADEAKQVVEAKLLEPHALPPGMSS